ncbi:MAG: UDP-N-acetylmuramoyl-tripeptide--D-alanyl-D-alanine ligase [Gemmatimonadetes bacterium]|nr:UDP-N-acetylmuramoyl-tripeptide--D-alanyl-D-alanine ligase [Gemmatimonadota bacterium]
MTRWTAASVCAALALETLANGEAVVYENVGTDTRTLGASSLFVALRGERHDAHAFLGAAAAAGARGAVVERIPAGAPDSLQYHVVPDTLTALGQLARFQRRRQNLRVCAVAGSNGKTTTKEMLRAALGLRHRVHATTGNLNNLVGVPLTLLATPADAEVAVIELGTNTPGEVARLAGLVEPDAAVVTSIAAEHLEGLGDLAGVLREETSVLPWLPESGIAVVSDQPPELALRARALATHVHVAGFTEHADPELRGTDLAVDEDGQVRFRWAERDVALRLRGRHNGSNALLALTLARHWGIRVDDAIRAISNLPPQNLRSEMHRYGELIVIADCYNANPGSVEAALDLLVSMPRRGGRVAILGSMLELGPRSATIHESVAKAAAALPIDLFVATGEFSAAFAGLADVMGDRLIRADDLLVAFERGSGRLKGDEVILLKASRGVRMERLLPRFEERWGVLHPHGEAFGSRASHVTGAGSNASAEHAPPAGSGPDAPGAKHAGGER